ncbi:hypothetical protein AgCh_022353 [Apium graveolens]
MLLIQLCRRRLEKVILKILSGGQIHVDDDKKRFQRPGAGIWALGTLVVEAFCKNNSLSQQGRRLVHQPLLKHESIPSRRDNIEVDQSLHIPPRPENLASSAQLSSPRFKKPKTVCEAVSHCLEQTCSPSLSHMGGLQFEFRHLDDVLCLFSKYKMLIENVNDLSSTVLA